MNTPKTLTAGPTVLVLAILCLTGFVLGIERLYPLDKTEALQLALAQSMERSGDWVTPAIDGLPYFDKPPLPYWIGAWLLHVAPQQVWLPRLGAAAAGCVGVIATWALVRFGSNAESPHRRDGRAVTAAMVLALTPAYVAFSRTAVHDIYLTASITTTLAAVFLFSQLKRASIRLQIWGGGLIGLSLGVGVLAKGLLSLGLPVVIAAAFLAVSGPPARKAFTWRFALALVVALLLVALPWHLAAWLQQGSTFVDNYLIRTHLHRFATELDDHTGPWFFYALAYPALTAPWSLAAAAAILQAGCLNPRQWRCRGQRDPLMLLCTLWIGVTVVALSVASTKLPHYILSTLPPTAIAAAHFFRPVGPRSLSSRWFSRLLLLGTAGTLLVAALLLGGMPGLLIPISQKTPGFSLALRAQLSSLPVVGGLLLLAAAGGGAAWRNRHTPLALGGLWAACLLSFLLFQAGPLLQASRHTVQDPRLAMASLALREARPDEPVAVVGQAWYSLKIHTQGRAEILNRGKAFGEANNAPAVQACARGGVLMGPSKSVANTVARCASRSFVLLHQNRAAGISLGRWQAKAPSASPTADPAT